MSDETIPIGTLWDYREAAEYLHVAPSTLRRKVMERSIPVLKPFGRKGRVLFSQADLRELVEKSRVPAMQASA